MKAEPKAELTTEEIRQLEFDAKNLGFEIQADAWTVRLLGIEDGKEYYRTPSWRTMREKIDLITTDKSNEGIR